MAKKGFLVLIDLSGYTEFLTQSELAEGTGILQSLIGTLLEHIERPLVVAELEGDAVFAYAPEGSFGQGQTLLEVLEKLYCVFAAAREQMQHNATCGCTGCNSIPRLDLKMVVHHGEFVLTGKSLGPAPKPMGSQVVLAHRLLKNRITSQTGVRSYAFITQACVDALGLEWLNGSATSHSETYEHVGVVHGYVHDLAPAWTSDRQTRLVRVEPTEAWIQIDGEVGAPTQVVWDVISSPDFKRLWHRAHRVEVSGGRAGAGTEYRCYRGEALMIDTVVDWQPFERLTLDCEWALGARVRMTLELSPGVAGTQLVMRLGRPAGSSAAHSLLVRSTFRLQTRRIERLCRANLETVRARAAAHPTVINADPVDHTVSRSVV